MWYVVRVGGPGRGSGLKLISGPHENAVEANRLLKNSKEEVWSLALCQIRGLIPEEDK